MNELACKAANAEKARELDGLIDRFLEMTDALVPMTNEAYGAVEE